MHQLFQFVNNHLGLSLTWLFLLGIFLFAVIKKHLSAVAIVSSSEAVQLINQTDAVVFDVRPKQAFDSGHITGAISVAASAIEANHLDELAQYRARQVIVVSEDGLRATTLAAALHKLGFAHLSVLREGIFGWNRDHLPLTSTQIRQKAKVEIYTRAGCPFCIRAKALLQQHGVVFEEVAVDSDEVKKQEMIKRSGRTSVPQIFIDGKHIGGCDDLHALKAKNGLAPLLH